MAQTPDPRSVITPEAFSVDPTLLGTPLSPPGRRFWALMLDAVAVVMITASTSSFWYILPFIIGFFFLSRALQKGTGRFSGVRRFSFGCLGVVVLVTSLAVVAGMGWWETNKDAMHGDEVDIAALLEEIGVDPKVIEESLNEPNFIEEDEIAEVDGREKVEGIESDVAEDVGGIESEVGNESDVDNEAIAELTEQVEDLQDELAAAREEVSLAQSGFGPWLRSKLDTLSFGLGWWSMYFAILMPWMGGMTPGKRVMGIRVVRLDGQPITWWHAFERAGGYAAGLATGLLGFVQIYWDPNRQAIHDKVAGTVVVLEGAQRVPGQWEHIVAAEMDPDPTTQ